MKNTPTEQIIDVTPEKVEIVEYVSANQKLVMLALALFLVTTAYFISQSPIKPYSSTEMIKPVFSKKVKHTPISQENLKLGDIIIVKGYLKSSVDNTLKSLQDSMDETRKILEKQRAMHDVKNALYKNHFGGDKSLSQEESRELLLKAGFKPAKTQPIIPESKQEKPEDGLKLSHSIAKELIRDEVEGFLLKVKLATQIGEYIMA
jgi:hypothetical protein